MTPPRPGCVLACAAMLVVGCGPGATPAAEAPAEVAAADAGTDELAAARLMEDVNWLCDPARKGRGSFQPGAADAATWIAARFAELGLEVVRQPVGVNAENVLGILRRGDDAVVVSAHYDHLGEDGAGAVYPGADDNASGVAVMLALARRAVTREHRQTIIFAAFGAEEVGLVGSARYVEEPAWPLERTRAVINFDMVGRHFFEAGAGKPATAAAIGLEDDPAARAAALAAADAAGLHLVPAPAGLLEVFGYAYRTDEWRFRHRGIKAYHFSTGFHDDYHQTTDTPDKLVPEQMRRVALTAAGLLDFLAD